MPRRSLSTGGTTNPYSSMILPRSVMAGKSFRVVYEPRINVLNFGGEIGFNVHEKISVISGLTFNQYTGLKANAEAWGLIPLEFKTALRIQIIKDLWLKGRPLRMDRPEIHEE
jgi:hypothetical protein